MEFVGQAAANRAGVGQNSAEIQSQAGEDARVGGMHGAIGFLEGIEVQVEGIGVLHQELRARITPKRGRISSRNLV